MKFKELGEKSTEELQRLLGEQREQLRKLRFKVMADEHKNVRDILRTRQTIARILTRLHQPSSKQHDTTT